MTLKTYRARTMGDALAEVKKDLGKDAVILHTRTYKVGGWLGLGGKPMVEITASDGGASPRQRRSEEPRPAAAALKAYGAPEPARATPAPMLKIEAPAPEPRIAAPAGAPVSLVAPMEQELAAIKRMVGQVLQCSRHTALRVGPATAGGPRRRCLPPMRSPSTTSN